MFNKNFAYWTYNDPYDKKAVKWALHCENPVSKFKLFFTNFDEFSDSFEERARWGECAGVTVYFFDGTKKKYPMVAWSS